MTWGACFALVEKYGADRIISAVYRYGAPPTISALTALLEEEEQQRNWQTCIADMCCLMVNTRLRGKKLPYYSELTAKGKPAKDTRSGEEIRQSVIAQLRSIRGEKR